MRLRHARTLCPSVSPGFDDGAPATAATVRRVGWLCGLLLALASALGSSSALANTSLSEPALLSRLTTPAAQLQPLPAGFTVSQLSSHDLTGGNVDGGSYEDAFGEVLPHNFIRRESGGYVLADEQGPGCLLRLWMTAGTFATQGDTSSFGNLQLFFDGSTTPSVDEPLSQFFAGKDPRFPRPLVNDHLASSGGNYSYVPFCFAHRLVVRVTGALATDQNYFQMTFLHAPAGTPARTFTGGAGIARRAAAALTPERAPASEPSANVSAPVAPGCAVSLPELPGAGTVRYLQISVHPFNVATLQSLALRVTVDGASEPQVYVPLADAFGDGLEVRPIKSLAFGMEPDDSTGYLALPIPYGAGANISLVSTGASAAVSMRAWSTPGVETAQRLHGQQLITQTQPMQDFPVLEADGSGHLASYVMDISDPGMPLSGSGGGQWFMEGDERVYPDGIRSPTIYGTGTEDEFNGGYYFNQGAFTLPLNGAGPLGQTSPGEGGTQSAYRVFADDGVTWSAGINYIQQAGGDDERPPETAVATTFSYRGPQELTLADGVTFGDASSETAHQVKGASSAVSLDAYFEGQADGTIPVSILAVGGLYYPSPPPEASSQSVSDQGIAFQTPISATLRVPSTNHGVVLRRLQDQNAPAPVAVSVNGKPAGIWAGAAFQGNSSKRWLESDYPLRPQLSANRSQIVVTLTPIDPEETASAYSLQALARG
jgi:D-arabinan exo alpha-(1,3)/(1,5)-arabinofuranosidase (non-reducing end)